VAPKARTNGLIIHTLEDETVVYDLERDRLHCLNPTAAFVFRICDGRTSPRALAKRVEERFGLPADEAIVGYALDQLERARLLEESAGPAAVITSRRELVRKVGLAGALAVLVPAVVSMVAPTPAAAASCRTQGGCCSNQQDCCPGLQCTGPRNCPPSGKQCL
jgi:hypothetical protein